MADLGKQSVVGGGKAAAEHETGVTDVRHLVIESPSVSDSHDDVNPIKTTDRIEVASFDSDDDDDVVATSLLGFGLVLDVPGHGELTESEEDAIDKIFKTIRTSYEVDVDFEDVSTCVAQPPPTSSRKRGSGNAHKKGVRKPLRLVFFVPEKTSEIHVNDTITTMLSGVDLRKLKLLSSEKTALNRAFQRVARSVFNDGRYSSSKDKEIVEEDPRLFHILIST